MSDDRTNIIIKEIHYWKEHHLLPSHYCDFLLALYTQGEENDSTDVVTNKGFNPIHVFFYLTNSLLLPLSLLVIYFTESNMIMQMLLLIIFVAASFLFYRFFSNTKALKESYSLIIFLLIIFLATIQTTNLIFSSTIYLMILTTIHCAIWFYLGWKKRLVFLSIAAVLGVITLIIFSIL
ncbi:hypothetical protein [Aquibacillus kalidii]|uniref:hypothetical protein n=1 Tax=Aquibacillus kalidii TaxID=2762597 RepID=UPI0016442D3E|nr:hypothetical protein [Aquibacillus kalidii]